MQKQLSPVASEQSNTSSPISRIETLLEEILHSIGSQKRLLSIEEACLYLGIGTTEGYARLRSHVRTVKFGRRILIPKEELDSLVEKAKRTGRLFD